MEDSVHRKGKKSTKNRRPSSFGAFCSQRLRITSGYATWFTAGGAIRIAHYDVNDDVITRKL